MRPKTHPIIRVTERRDGSFWVFLGDSGGTGTWTPPEGSEPLRIGERVSVSDGKIVRAA